MSHPGLEFFLCHCKQEQNEVDSTQRFCFRTKVQVGLLVFDVATYVFSSALNECNRTDSFRHECDQLCLDRADGYTCSCGDGFQLNTDGRTCIGQLCSISCLILQTHVWVYRVLMNKKVPWLQVLDLDVVFVVRKIETVCNCACALSPWSRLEIILLVCYVCMCVCVFCIVFYLF